MRHIEKIRLLNFRRFRTYECDFQPDLNIIVGDNEAGKSTILSAIDLVASGSRSKIDAIGLESLLNSDAVKEFLVSDRKYENLPRLVAEIYLNEQNDPDLNGKNNLDGRICDGIRIICEPNHEFGKDIKDILKLPESNFPFEFYSICFKTFSGESYSSYRRFLRHLLIDNTQTSNEYATREYIKDIYNSNLEDTKEKLKHHFEYRRHKENYKSSVLSTLNGRLQDYNFGIRTSSKSNLETDLTILEGDVSIENKGKGKQCFIKTDFALRKKNEGLDFILIEEPENHLSHINMKKLIGRISDSRGKQLFIATHSDLISSRLDLRKAILLNSNSTTPLYLKSLPDDTARFFMKAPHYNILQFVLSKKVLLVEGDAEYILMEAFFKRATGAENLWDSDIHVLSVGGISFKRYLDLAKISGVRTAVVTDNDGDYDAKIVENYSTYISEDVRVFADSDNDKNTFEKILYADNTIICDRLFSAGRRKLSVTDYMLSNKTDAAFIILDQEADNIKTPAYIAAAIEWIRK